MHEAVKNYYGNVLEGSQDLQTNACCTDEGLPEYVKPILGKIHDEVMTRYYGCGLIIPEQLEGLSVLRTLLADDLVHVSSGTVDNAGLGDAVGAAAALHARALARLIGHDGRTLLHRFLTQLQKVKVS